MQRSTTIFDAYEALIMKETGNRNFQFPSADESGMDSFRAAFARGPIVTSSDYRLQMNIVVKVSQWGDDKEVGSGDLANFVRAAKFY